MTLTALTEETGAHTNVAEGLRKVLADVVVETAKAQTYHWNVTGMAFGPLHALFQEIYEDHFTAQDELAERIKMMGVHVNGSLATSLVTSSLSECDGKLNARKMVKQLSEDQETISDAMLDVARQAESDGDMVTNDLLITRASAHDKFAWLLRAHLED
ncbi:MAG: DNA starvation/stationary phase protection protein [Pseudomonadota bacterium]